ncbi:ABC transporter ATP-binding protein [Thermosulfurimonas marina]|uniref:ABC transporter ATP-binding protein n=1 Tax=Thermosulfurimonas marina TaxID=2047767 RepID=A0A6H1WSS3_9BACT|nr:ABC transporter ATP-binding protein [Thermosulfurimonas marina]QJA06221.1 ABC transporter ATP-binding protein [Thermosulfurimonas marina]
MKEILRAQNLRYRYPDGREALRGVDLSVAEGERLVLIGPNGAGKSTLLLALAGLLEVEGEVLYRGEPLRGLRDPRRLELGILFQDPDDQLFCLTVYEDVAFGPRQMGLPEEEVRRRVTEALARVGLSGFEERSPHHLSFGERRRAALATVLSMGPRVLLLDEPTSNLDPRARKELMTLLGQIPTTQVIATHDLELAYWVAHRVGLVFRGRVVHLGSPEEVLFDEELLVRNGLELPLFVSSLRGKDHGGKNKDSRLSARDFL